MIRQGPSPAVAVDKSHDERARQGFIVTLKRKLRFELQPEISQRVADDLTPGLEAAKGAPLDDLSRDDRKAVKDAMADMNVYRAWQHLTYWSQGFMWQWTEDVLSHNLERLQNNFNDLVTRDDRIGSLTLNPALEIPAYIKDTEIHRQTGGFAFEAGKNDVTAGARYVVGSSVYSQGNNRGAGVPADWLIDQIQAKAPDLKPLKILDVGCGVGLNTTAYARRFPDAEVTGIDVAPGFLRYGHMNAESMGLAIHFVQMDAADLDFADDSFDLVVSHIVGHETSQRDLPRMIAECWRVVKPGGLVMHMDVPTQPGHLGLPEQVMNDWQVRYNGEHFWMGWADAKVGDLMTAAGVPGDCQIAEHMKRVPGGNFWFVHGARKPQDWSAARDRAA